MRLLNNRVSPRLELMMLGGGGAPAMEQPPQPPVDTGGSGGSGNAGSPGGFEYPTRTLTSGCCGRRRGMAPSGITRTVTR